MAEAEPDKWKNKCLALAEELDALQARAERTEKRLLKILARLICAFEGQSQRLDQFLEQLHQVVRRGLLDEQGLEQLDAASDVLLRASEQIRREKSSGEQGLHRQLLRLLEVVEIPPSLSDLGERLSVSLKQGCASEEALDETARLLAEINTRLRKERAEIEDFLEQLTAKLQLLEAQAQDVGRVLQTSDGNWNRTLTAQVAHLRIKTFEETDLAALKLVITDRLDMLTRQLRVFYQEETDRNAQAAKRIAALTERLQELEQESKKLRQQLKAAYQQALYDPVTGLPNRKATDERLAQEFSRWQRFHQPLSLLIWDIDHFKQINDRFGHQAGDKTLRIVGQTLREGIRAVDFVGRYGGEEFIMLLPGTKLEDALKVAEKLREAVKRRGFNSRGKPVPITISCGLSCARPGDTQMSLFERADKALYQAKQAGRDRCVSL